MINGSLPQLRLPQLAMILGADKVTIARELNIEPETNKEINIEEILEAENEAE